MKTALHRLLLLLSLVLLASPASAALEEIIGTWRRPDNSVVEFRPDGTIFTKDAQVGIWQKPRDYRYYIVRMNGAIGYFFETNVGSYQRKLTMKHSSTGVATTIDRIDNGPVQNPDVPDERMAMELEFVDLESSIERGQARLAELLAEAAEARQKHVIARSLGKISAWIPVAQKKEAEAKGMESSVNGQRDRLRKLALKLGKPAPQAAAPNMPSAPAMVVPATRGRSVPGQPMMPPGYAYPPGFVPPGYPPGMVPGGYPPGVVPVTPVTPVFGR